MDMDYDFDDEFDGFLPPAVVRTHTQPEQSWTLGKGRSISPCNTDTQEDIDTAFWSFFPLYKYLYRVRGTGDGVGKLARLPLELRFQIYSYVIDQDFKQHYLFDDYDVSLKPYSSKLPSIAHASRGTYREIWTLLQTGRPCKMTIGAGVATANFVLFNLSNDFSYDIRYYCSEVVNIPFCREATISIKVPRPRNASGMVEVRQTVEKLVRILNSVALPLPRIRITFETNDAHAHPTFDRDFVQNDFAMLIGPLYKLKHDAPDDVTIDRSVRRAGVVKKRVHHICTMIEEAVRGNASMELVTQQLCIDIKLPISRYISNSSISWRKNSPPMAYSAALRTSTIDLLHQLEGLYAKRGNTIPLWVSKAVELMSGGDIPFSNLKEEVTEWFGKGWVSAAQSWASGHLTSVNPIYDE